MNGLGSLTAVPSGLRFSLHQDAAHHRSTLAAPSTVCRAKLSLGLRQRTKCGCVACSSRMSLRRSLRNVLPTEEKPLLPGSAGGGAIFIPAPAETTVDLRRSPLHEAREPGADTLSRLRPSSVRPKAGAKEGRKEGRGEWVSRQASE